jgi:hypothetical protein
MATPSDTTSDHQTPTGNDHRTPTALPRGVSLEHREGRRLPWVLRWRDGAGRKSASYASEQEAMKMAARIDKARASGSITARPADLAKWRAFAEITGGADPVEVARWYIGQRTERSITLAGLIDAFAAMRRRAGLPYSTHMQLHFRRAVESLGAGRKLEAITPAMIERWAGGLTNPDTGEPMEPVTVRHHLKSLRCLLAHAVAIRAIEANPCDAVPVPRPIADDVSVLTLEHAQALFRANRDSLCVGRLALEAFGGLRYTSAARLQAGEILRPDRAIVMPASKHKSGRRQYVEGYPDNLWAWIEHAHPICWELSQRAYLKAKGEAFTRAGVPHPHNVLRHSFCSYHVALHRDAARTAVLLTHRNPAMLYQHYRGKATSSDAAAYFAIVP